MTAISQPLVTVEGVSKKFCRSLKRSLWYGVQDMAGEVLGGSSNQDKLRAEEFWAVRNASFALRPGECLGLIGRNGSGKTTLLKMLNGLIKPDTGRVEIHGRVGALIALGAGFNPILTGRENIYVNGAVLGLSKAEITGKIDDIIDYADIRPFIDSPVQSYSSGMQVRLGFAIATALQPDVLLLDEVLAVGDAAFRQKCYNTVGKLLKRCAVIFVSHSMEQIAHFCTHVAVMDRGTMTFHDDPHDGIALYEQLNRTEPDTADTFVRCEAPVTAFDLSVEVPALQFSDTLSLTCTFSAADAVPGCLFRIQFYSEAGILAAEATAEAGSGTTIGSGTSVLDVRVGPVNLKRGRYELSVLLYDSTRQIILAWSYRRVAISVDSPDWGYAMYRVPLEVREKRAAESSIVELGGRGRH